MYTKKMLSSIALAAALILPFGAGAFRYLPGMAIEKIPEGAEWLVGRDDMSSAGVLRPAPAAFIDRHSGRWLVRTEGMRGFFKRIWGEGFEVDDRAMGDPQIALQVAERFWKENSDLLVDGVSPDSFVLLTNQVSMSIRFVSHQQTLSGVPVVGTSNFIAIMGGRLVMLGLGNLPPKPFDPKPAITSKKAAALATEALAKRGQTQVKPGAPVLAAFPLMYRDRIDYRLVYEIELKDDMGRWTAFVDARTGDLFALKDERLFMTAKLHLKHHDEYPIPDEPLIDNPAPYINITTSDGSGQTDAQGEFTADGDSTSLTAEFTGEYVDVNNRAGDDLQLSAEVEDGETYIWETEETEYDLAQIDSYRFAAGVREHAKGIGPIVDDVDFLDSQVTTNVNITSGTCNAYASGSSINFLVSDGECNNTALLGAVVYHEYGHNFHFDSLVKGVGRQDGAASEGFSDTMAAAIQQTPNMGAYFFIGDPTPIRDLEPNKVWPDDQDSDVHITGLILGGALWDLRKAFIDRYGGIEGNKLTDVIFAGSMKTTGTIPTSYEAALLTDDDNGNLSDGTPNFCIITREYALHGLAEDNSMQVELSHQPVETAEPKEPIPIEADVSVGNDDECSVISAVRVLYAVDSADEGDFEEIEMESQGGDAYSAEIPGQPKGTELYYRIEVEKEQSGEIIMRPDNKAEPYYKIYIGPLVEILCEDLETEDAEWTHELISGDDEDGADDWHWGEPTGEGGDPPEAFSGTHVWGNDLQQQSDWDGLYHPQITNTLRSPEWDLSEYKKVRLQFRRWLGVEDGFRDQAKIYVNDEEVWSNAATSADDGWLHHVDKEWILFDLDISEQAAEESKVEIRWEISSDGEKQFGGWNIDDVCLYTVEDDGDDDDDTSDDDDDDTSDDDDDDDNDNDDTDSGGDDDDTADDDADDDSNTGGDSGGCGCSTPGRNPSRGFSFAQLI